jgi:hypothetical protein
LLAIAKPLEDLVQSSKMMFNGQCVSYTKIAEYLHQDGSEKGCIEAAGGNSLLNKSQTFCLFSEIEFSRFLVYCKIADKCRNGHEGASETGVGDTHILDMVCDVWKEVITEDEVAWGVSTKFP